MANKIFITSDGKNRAVTFALVCTLFLLSALCNSMIDVLNKQFQNSLGVSKAHSTFVQAVWYGAYFFMALPSGWIARRFGYRAGILTGLVTVIAGSLLFIPLTNLHASQAVVFAAFLGALFIVGAGLTFLETIANPYSTVLGPPESGVARINLGQSCNSVGWILGPLLASSFLLSKTGVANTSNAALFMPYLVVAGIVAVLVLVFSVGPIPEIHAPAETKPVTSSAQHERPLYKEMHFVLAIVSQFLYCAGQIGIFSFFVNYMKDDRYVPALPLWAANLLPATMKFSPAPDVWRITEYGAGVFCPWHLSFSPSVVFPVARSLAIAAAHHAWRLRGDQRRDDDAGDFAAGLAVGGGAVFKFLFHVHHVSDALRAGHPRAGRKDQARRVVDGDGRGRRRDPALFHGPDCGQIFHARRLMPLGCFAFIAFYGFSWRTFYRHDMEN